MTVSLTLLLLFFGQRPAYAAVECRMASGHGGTYTLANGASSDTIRWEVKNGYAETLLATVNLTLSPTLKSECSLGNDGEILTAKVDNSNAPRAAAADGNATLYRTNIPGIYFDVKIYTDGGGDFFKISGAYPDGWEIVEPDHNDERWDNKTWKALVHIYQYHGDFKGNKDGATVLTPDGSFNVGQIAIGNRNDSNNKPVTISVTPSSFQIPIVNTTCQAATLNDGATNIDLGDYMLSDFNVSPTSLAFSVQLKGCNNLYAADMKFTTNTTAGPDGGLLGNTLQTNAAAGVGVKILMGSVQIPPNAGTFTRYSKNTGTDVNSGDMIILNAQLVKDGSPMKAGDFKAVSTFVLNYY
nr:fimbrial protein [uncultured Enterobacter sp.]